MNLTLETKERKHLNAPTIQVDSKHVQALSFPSFATAQGVGECLKVYLYGGMDVNMHGCVWIKVVLKWEWMI